VIMAIREDRRCNVNPVPEKPANRISPTIHLRLDFFYDDALAAFNRFHSLCSPETKFGPGGLRTSTTVHSVHLTGETRL